MKLYLKFLFLVFSIAKFDYLIAEEVVKPTYKIGVIQSLTGIAAEHGNNISDAIKLATSEINAKGKIKVELVIEDDATDSKKVESTFGAASYLCEQYIFLWCS